LIRQFSSHHGQLSQGWCGADGFWQTHPIGESRRKALAARRDTGDVSHTPQVVDTLGGRRHVRSDEHATATPNGQLVFFAEFLATTGVFDRWVSCCPLSYRSGNAPGKRDVLGTLMLAMLAGTSATRTSPRCAARWSASSRRQAARGCAPA